MQSETKYITKSGTEQLAKLQDIVQKSIDEQKLVAENLLNEPKEIMTRGQSISDKVARFGGSWNFIISFSVIIICWIVFNVVAATANKFDPYPFILDEPGFVNHCRVTSSCYYDESKSPGRKRQEEK